MVEPRRASRRVLHKNATLLRCHPISTQLQISKAELPSYFSLELRTLKFNSSSRYLVPVSTVVYIIFIYLKISSGV